MKRYLWKRILFSILAFNVVILCVMILVYNLSNREAMFRQDETWIRKASNDRTLYEYSQLQRFGYIEYIDFATYLKNKYEETDGEKYYENHDYIAAKEALNDTEGFRDNPDVTEFLTEYAKLGYSFEFLPLKTYPNGRIVDGGNPSLLASREINVLKRFVSYIGNLIEIDSKNYVEDESLTERYIRVEKDPYSGLFAVVGSGTKHKYLLYFDNRFPFIHQNWISLNLGISQTSYQNQEITSVINTPQGDLLYKTTQYPTQLGTDEYTETALDFHTAVYNAGELSAMEKEQFTDKYSICSYRRSGLSMIETSFITGICGVIISYLLGVPLGVLQSRKKDKLADKLGNVYIIFVMSVPALAYIYAFSTIGTSLFKLPYKFAMAGGGISGYILPVAVLALPAIGGLMKWTRRYTIDQMSGDYVKFARAQGLSEQEIFGTHVARNALIYLMQGIPGSILGCLTGAIITEQVFGLPGVGGLLTNAISSNDNNVIIACTVFYTALSIISLILGDILLSIYDPRITLEDTAGED